MTSPLSRRKFLAGTAALGALTSSATRAAQAVQPLPAKIQLPNKHLQWMSEVKYQDPRTQCYLGNPSVLRTASGAILVTHDYSSPKGHGTPRNSDDQENLSSIYRSQDNGRTWLCLNHLEGISWGNLFEHRGAIYLLGNACRAGAIVILRSDDEGYTWTHPKDESCGLLFPAGAGFRRPTYHCGVTPVVELNGRLYRAFDDNVPKDPPRLGCRTFVISCDVEADLLNAGNWRSSNPIAFDMTWFDPNWIKDSRARMNTGEPFVHRTSWMEGCAVISPEGEIWDIVRIGLLHVPHRAAIVKISDEGRHARFSEIIEFPGGVSKFTIRRDLQTGIYWTLVNNCVNPVYPLQRNVLSAFISSDLRRWELACRVLDDDQGLPESEAVKYIGYQYADWQFDGDDIMYAVRASYDGAHNFHDANRVVFGRLEKFRGKTGGSPDTLKSGG